MPLLYDEQNRLVWAGNGTCGSGTLSSGLVGGGYTSPTTYTNLGQIWQGPVNGHGATEQYLYCNSAPHQLTGIYPTGTTCANKGSATAVYSAGYDAWGNETSRTYNSVTSTLSYDTLNRMTEYNAGSAGQEFYLYDGSGNRVLKRSISGRSTKLTVYAFGLQELSYTGAGAYSSQTDYYSIAGHLLGSTNGTATTYDLTDAEGSVLTSLSASAVLGEQIYGPYGNQRYTQGTMGTDKGYTGQFQDAVSGFDYYNARYYDPVMGQFLSADSVQGNAEGMDPYNYVGSNPETYTDPTGQWSWGDVLGFTVAAIVVAVVVIAVIVLAPEVLAAVAAAGAAEALAAESSEALDASTADTENLSSDLNDDTQSTTDEKPSSTTGEKPSSSGSGGNTTNDGSGGNTTNDGSGGNTTNDGSGGNTTNDGSGGNTTNDGSGGNTTNDGSGGNNGSSDNGGGSGSGFGKLTNQVIQVTQDGINAVQQHLSRFLQDDGSMYPQNVSAINRLQQAYDAGEGISGGDASFYTHELFEKSLMDQGIDYDAAHNAALGEYGVSPFSVYSPEVIQENPSFFNVNWFRFWGLLDE